MKIGYVSTYPPMRCAIGVYTRHLARALLQREPEDAVEIFTERGVDPRGDATKGITVHPIYDRAGDYVAGIERAAVEAHCDLVHFQHAGDLLGEDERLPNLLRRLGSQGIRSVVTLHTVYEERPNRLVGNGTQHADFYRAVAAEATHLVVHQDEGCAERLVQQGISRDKITVIPHGTTLLNPPGTVESRRALALPEDSFLFTFFGFIHLQKNVHRVVEAFARIATSHPRARLLICGMPWGDRWYNHLYVGLIKARVTASGKGEQILIRDRYLDPSLVDHIYGASDVIVLPHNQTYGSASGVFHQAIGAGKAVLCATGPKFVEAKQALAGAPELCVPPKDIAAWSMAMKRLLEDPELLERGKLSARTYAAETEWPTVAALHRELYGKLLG
jgi:glycosyltransferase involved in cell wall biosynthesis